MVDSLRLTSLNGERLAREPLCFTVCRIQALHQVWKPHVIIIDASYGTSEDTAILALYLQEAGVEVELRHGSACEDAA
jgi:hypothetical protein